MGARSRAIFKNGDVVRIEIGGIGVLENEIVERSA
jgi:2-keto-4-pentenoate hydratase/2-oxohepta-3-ene-1,7-dioic acid hydratase in catechol pathway